MLLGIWPLIWFLDKFKTTKPSNFVISGKVYTSKKGKSLREPLRLVFHTHNQVFFLVEAPVLAIEKILVLDLHLGHSFQITKANRNCALQHVFCHVKDLQ